MEDLLDLNQAFYGIRAADPARPLTVVIGTTTRTDQTATLQETPFIDDDGLERTEWHLRVPRLVHFVWTSTEWRVCSVFGRPIARIRRVDWDAATHTLQIKL